MELTMLRHAYPEPAIYIDRRNGHPDYTFLHFYHSVNIRCGEEELRTRPHAVILYRPGTPQFFTNRTPIVHDWIHFRGNAEALLAETGLEADRIYYPARTEFITELTREMENEFYGAQEHGSRLIELKLEELFLKLGRAVYSEPVPSVNMETKEKLRYLRGRMFSSLNEKWPVERMAEETGYSPSRFFHLYRTIYGISPTADLIEARINSAENMLLSTSESIQQIAARLGYENPSHFIRQFRSRTGFSPSAYRKENR